MQQFLKIDILESVKNQKCPGYEWFCILKLKICVLGMLTLSKEVSWSLIADIINMSRRHYKYDVP